MVNLSENNKEENVENFLNKRVPLLRVYPHCCGTAPLRVRNYAGFQQNRDSQVVEYQSTSFSLSFYWETAEI